MTNSGIAVRSKSELIIANTLDMYNVLYRYEAALELNEVIKYPDFTIKRPTDGSLVYWEHFGLMDRPEYVKSMAAKFHFYADNNITPYRNFICSFEDDIRNGKRIHQLIEWFIL